MAARTSSQSGPWSDTATWGGSAVPVSGDTVTVSAGHTVTFDVDQSGFAAGLASLTINGTLVASTTAGSYVLRMAGPINGGSAGQLQAGSSGTPYPSTCTFEVRQTTAASMIDVSGGLTLKLYCTQPTNKYARILAATTKAITGITQAAPAVVTCVGHGFSAGNAIAITGLVGMDPLNYATNLIVNTVPDADHFTLRVVSNLAIDSLEFPAYVSGGLAMLATAIASGTATLNVDRDLTGDTQWANGKRVVVGTNSTVNETLTISSVASGSITFTSNTTGTKVPVGGIIILASRNVRIVSTVTITSAMVWGGAGGNGGHVINAEFSNGGTGNCLSGMAPGIVGVTFGGTMATTVTFPLGATKDFVSTSDAVACQGTFYPGTLAGTCVFGGLVAYIPSAGGSTSTTVATTVTVDAYLHCAAGNLGGASFFNGTFTSNAFIYGATAWQGNNTTFNCNWQTLGGQCLSGNNNVFNGWMFGAFVAMSGGIGNTLAGRVIAASNGVSNSAAGLIVTGTIEQCTRGIANGVNGVYLTPTAVLKKNSNDIGISNPLAYPQVRGVGASLLSAAQIESTYLWSISGTPPQPVVIWDYAGVTGALRAWCLNGTITDAVDQVPTGYSLAYKFTFQQAAGPVFIDVPITLSQNTVSVSVAVKKSANGMTETPKAQIVDVATNAVLATATMADDTNWQTLTISYTPTTNAQLAFRVRGTNASGNLWANWTFSRGTRAYAG